MQFIKKHTKLAVSVAFCVALICFDLSPFGGNIYFYMKWAECGQRPYEVASKPGVQWYQKAPLFAVMRTQRWYCTPLEAERAGYSASSTSWEFPHIK